MIIQAAPRGGARRHVLHEDVGLIVCFGCFILCVFTKTSASSGPPPGSGSCRGRLRTLRFSCSGFQGLGFVENKQLKIVFV